MEKSEFDREISALQKAVYLHDQFGVDLHLVIEAMIESYEKGVNVE